MKDKIIEEIKDEIREMQFIGQKDLYENIDFIKGIYKKKDRKIKEFYKWYFYCQLSVGRRKITESMWEYLNDIITKERLDEIILEIICLDKRKKK